MVWGPISSGLAAHWDHSETSGSTLADSSTNSNTATLINSPTLGVTSVMVGGDGAVTYDGTNDRATISIDASVDNSGAWTVETWVYWPSTPGTEGTIFTEGFSGGSDTIQVFLGFDVNGLSGKLCTGFYDGSAWQLASVNTPSNSDLHHIVGRWDGTELSLWVDGVEAATFTPSSTSPSALTDALHIGVNYHIDSPSTTRYLNFTSEEIALYDRALSDSEIEDQYALNAETAPTIALSIDVNTPVYFVPTTDISVTAVDPQSPAEPIALSIDVNTPIVFTPTIALSIDVNTPVDIAPTIALSVDVNTPVIQVPIIPLTLNLWTPQQPLQVLPALAAAGVVRSWRCTLIASGYADYVAPIENFSARLQYGDESYVAVTVNDLTAHQSSIEDRSAGEILLQYVDTAVDGTQVANELARVDIETLSVYRGATSQSIRVEGRRYDGTAAPRDLELAAGSYMATTNGAQLIHRGPPSTIVLPGDRVTLYDDTVMIAGVVTYNVGASQTMEIQDLENDELLLSQADNEDPTPTPTVNITSALSAAAEPAGDTFTTSRAGTVRVYDTGERVVAKLPFYFDSFPSRARWTP